MGIYIGFSYRFKISWIPADENSIANMVGQSKVRRHQILDGKIGASYGHSIEGNIFMCPVEPPTYLYHGTLKSNLYSIKENGLDPMTRQKVHLSSDEIMARIVASRREGKVIVLKIRAKEAFLDNVQFYSGGANTWLSDRIPPEFVFDLESGEAISSIEKD